LQPRGGGAYIQKIQLIKDNCIQIRNTDFVAFITQIFQQQSVLTQLHITSPNTVHTLLLNCTSHHATQRAAEGAVGSGRTGLCRPEALPFPQRRRTWNRWWAGAGGGWRRGRFVRLPFFRCNGGRDAASPAQPAVSAAGAAELHPLTPRMEYLFCTLVGR
jgi:hypothetical protein